MVDCHTTVQGYQEIETDSADPGNELTQSTLRPCQEGRTELKQWERPCQNSVALSSGHIKYDSQRGYLSQLLKWAPHKERSFIQQAQSVRTEEHDGSTGGAVKG